MRAISRILPCVLAIGALSAAGAAAQAKWTIGMSQCSLEEPWRVQT